VRGLVAFSGAAMLCACVSAPAPAPALPRPPPVDASYDWHGLLILPFGTLLRDSPLPLHEVLLFQDVAQAGADTLHQDCYAIDGAPPPFVGRRPDEYLLCFSHDRLIRIDASVRLPAASAGALFAAACAQWRGTRAPAEHTLDSCEGRDGMTRFSARLAAVPEAASAPVSAPAPESAALSISLFAAEP
jgi:hypothetical protein